MTPIKVNFMDDKPVLSIARHKKEIISTIQEGRVTIISGKTGSGKSTQVPQFILESDPNAIIAVCEPRRIAASSLATQVSR